MSYTNGLDDPSAYFQTALFTGNAGTNAITNTGNSDLQPDWVWFKCRSATEHHGLFDSVRGVTKAVYSNLANAEDTLSDSLASFNSDGFTMGADTGSGGAFNGSGKTMAAWQWKAGTSFTNDASSTGIGSIDSAGSVNDTSGFSIVTYTAAGAAATIKHGLSSAPKMIITKKRNGSPNWGVYYGDPTDYLELNTTAATQDDVNMWNDTAPTSSVFSVGGDNKSSGSGNYVAYCFAEKQGYSKFGSYVGNGNVLGTFCFTGQKSEFIMIKRTSGTGGWFMFDNKRDTFNLTSRSLQADVTGAENNYTAADTMNLDILSNGFKLRSTDGAVNRSGDTYIYMAFAENPFVTSTGVPATAR